MSLLCVDNVVLPVEYDSAAISASLTQWRSAYAECHHRMESLQNRLRISQNDVGRLRNDLNVHIAVSSQHVSSLHKELSEMTAQCHRAENERDNIENECSEQRRQYENHIAALTAQQTERAALAEELEALKRHNASLSAKLEIAEHDAADKKHAEAQAQSAAEQVALLKREAQTMILQHGDEHRSQENTVQQLQAQLATVCTQLNTALAANGTADEYHQKDTALLHRAIAKWQNRCQDREQQISELNAEIDKLKAAESSTQYDGLHVDLQSRIDQLERDQQSMQKRMKQQQLTAKFAHEWRYQTRINKQNVIRAAANRSLPLLEVDMFYQCQREEKDMQTSSITQVNETTNTEDINLRTIETQTDELRNTHQSNQTDSIIINNETLSDKISEEDSCDEKNQLHIEIGSSDTDERYVVSRRLMHSKSPTIVPPLNTSPLKNGPLLHLLQLIDTQLPPPHLWQANRNKMIANDYATLHTDSDIIRMNRMTNMRRDDYTLSV